MEQPNRNVGTRKDLVLHRIQTAKSDLHAAGILLDAEEYCLSQTEDEADREQ